MEGSDAHGGGRRFGTGFLGILTILFIALKLTGYIDWPRPLVLAPAWIGLVLFALAFVLLLAYELWKRS